MHNFCSQARDWGGTNTTECIKGTTVLFGYALLQFSIIFSSCRPIYPCCAESILPEDSHHNPIMQISLTWDCLKFPIMFLSLRSWLQYLSNVDYHLNPYRKPSNPRKRPRPCLKLEIKLPTKFQYCHHTQKRPYDFPPKTTHQHFQGRAEKEEKGGGKENQMIDMLIKSILTNKHDQRPSTTRNKDASLWRRARLQSPHFGTEIESEERKGRRKQRQR